MQWVDPDTVIACDLTLLDEDNIDRPLALTDASYMLVKDYLDDADVNTFKSGDYLVASPDAMEEINSLGCWNSVYQIKGMYLYNHRIPQS